MKILITGGHGQLGHDVTTLLSKDHTVTSCSSQQLDIGNKQMVDNAISQYQPNVIINCAAYTAVDNCESEKELAWRVNALGPENLAIGAETCGSRLIHISTDYVFDGKKPVTMSYHEDDHVQPLSEYGKSKLAGEDAILRFASNPLIMRTAWLYGHTGNNFLKTMLRLSLAAPERELKVVNDQHGSLTWTRSLARQIRHLLQSDIKGIVHATATGSCTWYEGACYFLDTLGVPYKITPCTTEEYPTPAHRPSNSILENRRLEKAGVSVLQSWQDDINEFVTTYGQALVQELSPQDK